MELEREEQIRRSGYLATFIGACCGAVLLAFGIGAAAAFLEMQAKPDDGWAGLMGAVVGGTVGAAVGAGLGTWAALRWRRHERAGITGAILAFAVPAWLAASFWLTTTLCSYRCFGPFDSQATMLIVGFGGLLGVVELTRWIVVRARSRHGPVVRP